MSPWKPIVTKNGYEFGECSSAMQKAIRRADARLAGWFAMELTESGYGKYVFGRLLTVSAEDVADPITREILALKWAYDEVREAKSKVDDRTARIFISKAVILLCQAMKSRDADHLGNLVYDARNVTDDEAAALLEECRAEKDVKVPEYAFDVHTRRGRKEGKTKQDFFREEFEALKPCQPGLFDNLIE